MARVVMTDSGSAHHNWKRQAAVTGNEIIGMHSFFDKTGQPS